MVTKKFDHNKIEKKWQKRWEEEKVFYTQDMLEAKNPFYNLWMFPYPSGEGLHAGHAFASTGSDVFGKYMRMNQRTVFQPIGYDSFGIHSENFALKIGEHPQTMLDRTSQNYANQLKSLGHGYDWTRTVKTSDKEYYQWTQWLFVQMFKAGLAYRKEATVNWCPSCKTVLADEQVVTPAQAGKIARDAEGNEVEGNDLSVCERCGTIVEKRNLEQWFFRITKYADKLLENLGKIDWTEKIKIAQSNWIGRKQGINITYPIRDSKQTITVWTSRPETNFGATFIVVAPEFAKKNLDKLLSKEFKEDVDKYIKTSLKKTKEDRISEGKEKTGVFTGLYAVNQLNDYEMPIWIADFVLSGVGTGAVVGVPGHDLRDFEFAKQFGLPIKRVIKGSDGDESEITREEQVQEEEGKMINSEFLNGLDIHEASQKMMDYLEDKGWGERTKNYHLRDWLISRQRYWGPPIPMVYCRKCAENNISWFDVAKNHSLIEEDQSDWNVAGWFPEENLPVELPILEDFKPKGGGTGPLDDHPEFYKTTCPNCGGEAKRETDVSDTFLDSSWYFLAYPMQNTEVWNNGPSNDKDSSNTEILANEIIKTWLPVDLYFGGAEHAVLHLMYARFVTMVLHDLNYIDFDEPFPRFFAHGLMIKDGAKMSKSRGNVVNPDEYIEKFGADTLRLYLMFMGPMDGYPDFRDTGIEGMRRFVERVWDLYHTEFVKDLLFKQVGKSKQNDISKNKILSPINPEDVVKIYVKMHQTIKKVTNDIENYRYNTAISAIMEYVSTLRDFVLERSENNNSQAGNDNDSLELIAPEQLFEAFRNLALLLAPFAPHMSEELWQEYFANNPKSEEKKETANGKFSSIHTHPWPTYDEEATVSDMVDIIVQVNGRLRDTIQVNRNIANNKEKVLEEVKQSDKVQKWLEGNEIKETIFVASKLVNFVL